MALTEWDTALVTGASTGIGEAFARRLAAAGTDLVVTARDEERLEALAAELRERDDVAVEVLPADLSTAAGRAVIERRLGEEGRPIDLLVNNAGFGTHGRFADLDPDRLEAEIGVNVVAVMRLTHAALGPMLARRRGTILNVSSLASRATSPANADYSATKAYVSTFTESVHEGLRGEPVTVSVLEPGYTRSEFQARSGFTEDAGMPGFVWMSPDEVARHGLEGAAAGRAVIHPGLGYQTVSGGISALPRGLRRRVIGVVARRSEGGPSAGSRPAQS